MLCNPTFLVVYFLQTVLSLIVKELPIVILFLSGMTPSIFLIFISTSVFILFISLRFSTVPLCNFCASCQRLSPNSSSFFATNSFSILRISCSFQWLSSSKLCSKLIVYHLLCDFFRKSFLLPDYTLFYNFIKVRVI